MQEKRTLFFERDRNIKVATWTDNDQRYGPRRSEYATLVQKTAEGFEVTVTIDLEALFDWMGSRAAHTKSGVSKLQDGMIVATARKISELGLSDPKEPAWIEDLRKTGTLTNERVVGKVLSIDRIKSA